MIHGTAIRAGAVTTAALALASCFGDLSRSAAEGILNGESRGAACVSGLDFIDGGFEKAKSSQAISIIRNESGLLGNVFLVASLPGGDRWHVVHFGFEKNPKVSRKVQSDQCLPGRAEVTTIADAPFAPVAGSYKVVEFVEIVTIPAELERLKPYVFMRYNKSQIFQKTDRGWRVAR
jgi:hypothetical protein